MEKCLVRWEAYQIKMKAQRWGEGDFPSQRKRLGANQVSEGSATKTTPTPLTSTASPRGPGRGQQAPPFVTETNPASPFRTQASFVPSHQVSKSSSESPTLSSQSCILSSRQRHIFSWLFLSFYPRTTQQFHQGLRGYRSVHSLRGPNHIHPDPGHNSRFPTADFFLVKLFELQLSGKTADQAHYLGGPWFTNPLKQVHDQTPPWSWDGRRVISSLSTPAPICLSTPEPSETSLCDILKFKKKKKRIFVSFL